MSTPRTRGAKTGWRGAVGLALGVLVLPGTPRAEEPPAPGAPSAGGPVAESRLIDRVVAVIGSQVLTLSELEFEARVALVQRGGVRALEAPLDERTLQGALELTINQRLLVAGADRLQAFPAERSEVEARFKSLRARFPDESSLQVFLTRHDADLDQLMGLLERGVRAERILDSRVRLRAQVSEAEARRYWEEHKASLGGPYEAVRESLRDTLMRERYGQLAKEEFAQARATARVRRVAPFAREARP